MAFYVYILAGKRHGTLYVGVTNNLVRRVWEHREGIVEGFTKRYGVKRLVYFETFEEPGDAIAREKTIKKWRKDWKINVIERENPDWMDLYDVICQ
jgi:putative endonuclease